MSAAQTCSVFTSEKTCLRQIKNPRLPFMLPHRDSQQHFPPTASIEQEGFL